jgi:site-specific DNA-methyltransferase (adenine-specific)
MYSSGDGDHETPQEFFDELDAEFSFTLDAAASRANAKCKQFLSEPRGLTGLWTERVWLNPPYGRGIMVWVDKIIEEVPNTEVIVVLLPSRTDTAWWRKAAAHADEVRFVAGRLHFNDSKNAAPFPSCVMVFRKKRSGRRKTIRGVLSTS